ncbi:MAG: PAS domain S-box protein [Rhodothermales bacterium]
MAILTVMFGLVALGQLLALRAAVESPLVVHAGTASDLLALSVSTTALVFVFLLGRILTRRGHNGAARYQTLVEQASDGIFLADHEGRYISVNRSGLEMLGYTEEELLQRKITDLVPKEDLETDPIRFEALFRGETLMVERRLIRKDGTLLPVEISAKMLPDGCLQGIVRDITERKQAEEALRESRERLAMIMSISPVGIFHSKPDGGYFYGNRKADELSGMRFEEAKGDQWMRALHPDDRKRVGETWLHAVLEKRPFTIECRFLHPDGKVVWVMAQAEQVTDETGKSFGYVGTLTDITVHKQFEAALNESEKRYRGLFENAPFSVWEEDFSDVQSYLDRLPEDADDDIERYLEEHSEVVKTCLGLVQILDVNREALVLHRAEDKSALLGGLERTFTQASFEAFRKELVAIKRGETSLEMAAEVQTLDGEKRNVVMRWVVPPGYESSLSRVYVTLIDDTERGRAEEALRESEQRYRQVLQTSMDGYILADTEGSIVDVNPAYCAMVGYTRDELLQMNIRQLEATFSPEEVAQKIQEMLQQGEARFETRHRRKNGEGIDLEAAVSIMHASRTLVASFVRDITKRKEAEAEREQLIRDLEAKNTELERFTYTVSHDLKSPLVTIRGFLGWLEKDARSGDMEHLEVDIEQIRTATEKMKRLLDELLELSRIGRLMNMPEEVSLAALAQDAVDLLAGRIEEQKIDVVIDPGLPCVLGDRVRLLEVFQNLIDNAAKFMGAQPQPRIDIGLRKDGEEDVIFVKDNGMGIEAKYHEKVFGLFDRLHHDREGTGIGLALAKRIVEVQGGRIWVESEGVDCGSTFCFTLSQHIGGSST